MLILRILIEGQGIDGASSIVSCLSPKERAIVIDPLDTD